MTRQAPPGPWQDAVANYAQQQIARAVEQAVAIVAEKYKITPAEVAYCMALVIAKDAA